MVNLKLVFNKSNKAATEKFLLINIYFSRIKNQKNNKLQAEPPLGLFPSRPISIRTQLILASHLQLILFGQIDKY